jgi:SAM-dependent methyltransferase
VERQRLLMLYLQRETGLLADEEAAVLEFAPETGLSDALSSRPNLRYESADIRPGIGMPVMDMRDIPRDEATYDYVVASHVLEFIVEDRTAMGELFRVLRPGGVALIQEPVDHALAQTHEDYTLTPEEQLREFGQKEKVRLYGPDLAQRLADTGFDVNVRRYRDELSEEERRFYRLEQGSETFRSDDVYECVKPQIPLPAESVRASR